MKSSLSLALALSLTFAPAAAFAQGPKSPATRAALPTLSVADYLAQVKSKNPTARALVEGVEQTEGSIERAGLPLVPELYASYGYMSDRNEPTNAAMPSMIEGATWKAGVRQQTDFGLSADLYFDSTHSNLYGGNVFFLKLRDYNDSRFGLSLKQSLWRDGFGEATRNDVRAQRAANRIDYLKARLQLKDLLTRAENTYWSLSSYVDVVKLQQENVERARRLRDFMRGREGMRLVDDVDALQAQTAFESRELELQQSLDEMAQLKRAFNTLRGLDSDEVEPLAQLPTGELLAKEFRDPAKRMSREDFKIIFEQAQANEAASKAQISKLNPELNLVANFTGNGLDQDNGQNALDSYGEAVRLGNPTMQVGVTFSVPLDFGLVRKLKRASRAQARAGEGQRASAEFEAQRAWNELLKQKGESQGRFEKASSLEQIQTKLVERERVRLMNGRTTTFQLTSFEQNLALAQIQRVRLQLALVQIHNLLKQFEANL